MPLSRRILLAYALPAVVVSLPIIPVYIHLPRLYGIELGLGLAAVGWILLAARLFDTVTDPLIGALSDRTRIAGCRRKPWIAVGAMVAGIGLWQVLMPPDASGSAYLLVWSMVLYGGWTMVAVPYLTWGAELSGDYHERSRVTSWREALGLIGIVGAAVLSSALTEAGRSERDAMAAIVWVAVLGGAAVIPLLLWTVPERPPPAGRPVPRARPASRPRWLDWSATSRLSACFSPGSPMVWPTASRRFCSWCICSMAWGPARTSGRYSSSSISSPP